MQLEDSMKSVQEAKNTILENTTRLATKSIALSESLGYITSEDIFSELSLPNFRQSAMDGYAIRLADIHAILMLQDELPAGTDRQIDLLKGSAVKVFTGGPIPAAAEIVVQKEWVAVSDHSISVHTDKINGKQVHAGMNIREPGSAVEKNRLVLEKNTVLNSFRIALLASIGFENVVVYKKPKVVIIITGNELVQPGETLLLGQVYESNSFGLNAALNYAGVAAEKILFVKDDFEKTVAAIDGALEYADIILLTGGVSVGDYDFVARACAHLDIETLFHGVKQKPGKPFYCGKKDKKLVFGLPGNPASVLSCFHQYVLPALAVASGKKPALPIMMPLQNRFEKKLGLSFFLKGLAQHGMVNILPEQASYQLTAFAQANCWVEITAEITVIEAGTLVPIYQF